MNRDSATSEAHLIKAFSDSKGKQASRRGGSASDAAVGQAGNMFASATW